MFLGVAIGDALGMPVETLTAEQIAERFGRITDYLQPTGHKWYNGWPAGRWTDDTQLTLVIAESLIATGKIDLDDIASRSITTMDECSIGWGASTKKSLQAIKRGVYRLESGNPQCAGNGVAMKVAPLAAYLYAPNTDKCFNLDVIELALMTHQTDMAVFSAIAQIQGLFYCLACQNLSDGFIANYFIDLMVRYCDAVKAPMREKNYKYHMMPQKLADAIYSLKGMKDLYLSMTPAQIASHYNGADCYVLHSLPFTLAMFLRNPFSIETLYDTVSAGGDTDSNGSMVAALLGALNSTKIFPAHLIDGLWQKEKILQVANDFCDRFDIK